MALYVVRPWSRPPPRDRPRPRRRRHLPAPPPAPPPRPRRPVLKNISVHALRPIKALHRQVSELHARQTSAASGPRSPVLAHAGMLRSLPAREAYIMQPFFPTPLLFRWRIPMGKANDNAEWHHMYSPPCPCRGRGQPAARGGQAPRRSRAGGRPSAPAATQ